ncbi:hypothetical protein [Alloactinosynnema sp. L-07]|uniref:hypothetical protein n=1 Tax=Alloactinosynnema sp. L-07 TaxID=1653480 RepID=UPI00065F09E2|nr:hypothetical protein [Alloactinosynnema sp. L-07]CRK59214.1 hypothetical protein [Alloactinosynnema sp. L-07]
MFKRALRIFALAIAALAALLLPGTVATASNSGADTVAACRYATYAPARSGSNVTGWGEKWECGGSTSWTITLQRHRGGGWWQNEARNYATGDGWVSVTAGCVPGTWTYRTILESNVGHKTVSSHAAISC